MALQTHIVRNANVLIDGRSLLGQIEEFTGPHIKPKMSSFKPLGLLSETELQSGFEKMEAKFKFTSIYAEVLKKVANFFQEVSIQVRSSIEVYTGSSRTAEQPYVCYLRGTFKSMETPSFKQLDPSEQASEMNVTYCKIEINGEEIIEIDILNNIYKVAGVDMLANYRANLGL